MPGENGSVRPWRSGHGASPSPPPPHREVRGCWTDALHAAIGHEGHNAVLRFGFSGVEFFMMLSGYVLARPYSR